ncbi:tetratricopeptide repeat protein [Azospirillum sp. TSO22-1]|uniref:tetratricopeptide repeat protein n=1 Tax=Azospirillum sp. TSO22-1 TaxID=716789 RepID=UPI000D65D23F|nr:tetratricopeptide repeat protein [Azospirillum sp. TSO22-1]
MSLPRPAATILGCVLLTCSAPSLALASVGITGSDFRTVPSATDAIGSAPAAWRPVGGAPDGATPIDEPEGDAAESGEAGIGRSDAAAPVTAELRKEAEDGDAEAQYELATAYAVGGGVPRDPATAAQWMEKAALQDFPPAVADLGVMYLHGDGVPRDLVRACALLTAAIGLAVPAEIRPEVACGELSADDRKRAEAIAADRALWRGHAEPPSGLP